MDFSGCWPWWVAAALAFAHPLVPPTAHLATSGVADGGASPAVGRAAAVLHRWDAARAAAWAEGDADELRGLYTRGSAAGRADVHLLRRYTERGLLVRGLRTQVFSIRVLNRAPGRLLLRVEDRLVGGVAVGASGCVPLPHDRADRRTMTLQRVGERWLVAAVR